MTGVQSLVPMASPSTQSLNQFADKVSKAEALSAEIASIHRGLASDPHSAIDPKSSPPRTKRAEEWQEWRGFNTPISV
jgi:hypothetical protein